VDLREIPAVRVEAVESSTSVGQMESVWHVDGIRQRVVRVTFVWKVKPVERIDYAICVVALGISVVKVIFAIRDIPAIPIMSAKLVDL
jgi:hypothetical protein